MEKIKHSQQNTSQKPKIGITIGDFNGIGPEVILKVLSDNRLIKLCTPVVYGSMKIFSKYRKILKINDFFINQIHQVQQANHKKANLININKQFNPDITPSMVSEEAGQFAWLSLKQATQDLRAGNLQALVTAPINKNNMQQEGFQFPGHTEFFANAFGKRENLMFLVAENLKVAVVTGHIPLKDVSSSITPEKLQRKLQILLHSLRYDFGITKPRVAVLGLNPHAGEDGLLGEEELKVIRPVIIENKKKGNLVFGPYPADGFFASETHYKFDAVLAMYHDQGLIPFKTLAFEQGVNFTAGLPVIRTSPDHGTAYDIAGKNLADPSSMLQAIFLAIDITKHRQRYQAANLAQQ